MQTKNNLLYTYSIAAISALSVAFPAAFAQDNTVFSIDAYTTAPAPVTENADPRTASSNSNAVIDASSASAESSTESGNSSSINEVLSAESTNSSEASAVSSLANSSEVSIESDATSSTLSVSSSLSKANKEVKLYRQGVLVQTIVLDKNHSISSIANMDTASSSIASLVLSSEISSESSSSTSSVAVSESSASSSELRSSAPVRSSISSIVQIATIGIAIIGGGVIGIISLKNKKRVPAMVPGTVNEQMIQNKRHEELEKAIHS